MFSTVKICCGYAIIAPLAVMIALVASQLVAQQPSVTKSAAPAAGAPANAPAAILPAAPSSSSASADAALRAKIMASAEWKRIGDEYQSWLSTQPIYTPGQIKRINDNLAAQIQSMSASDLQDFMSDWQAKLKVLNGKNFQEAQNWLGAYMTNMADGYRRNYLKSLGLTDIPSMTAGQLEAAITNIRANQENVVQSQATFNATRRQMVQNVQQDNATSQQAQSQSYTSYGSSGFNTFQSPYRPPKFNPPPQPQMRFWMNSNGQLSYLLPF
jgi:hypothetical protein